MIARGDVDEILAGIPVRLESMRSPGQRGTLVREAVALFGIKLEADDSGNLIFPGEGLAEEDQALLFAINNLIHRR